MHCQKCGKKLKPGETFCSICGYYNSEDEIVEESENWDAISSEEIEIEDDDTEKWFEDEIDTPTSEEDKIESEKPKKESFWEKKKKEREEKKEKEAAAKAEKEVKEAEVKAEKQAQAEKEQLEKQKRKEQLESQRQEREYQKALERQQKNELPYNKNDDDYDDLEEKFLRAYIGEDYEKIRNKNFNLLAAILNWAYVLYRKLYVTGIFGLLLTEIVILKYPKFAIFYAIFVVLLLGFGFNKYYLFFSKLAIKKQKNRFEGSDDYSMEKILSRKGGVNVILTLIIYLIFLGILFYGMFHFTINKTHNTKFWNENTNNAANCISLTKTSYNYLPNVEINGQIVESTCKVLLENDKKEYAIYLKLLENNKIIYAYFQTENSYLKYRGNTKNVSELESRQASNILTPEEKQILNELKSIQLTYDDVYEKSKEEEKLIKTKKNTRERTDFAFTKEEITR